MRFFRHRILGFTIWIPRLLFVIFIIILITSSYFGLRNWFSTSDTVIRSVVIPHAEKEVLGEVVQVEDPLNTEFSIMIPAIQVNAPVKAEVDGMDVASYEPEVLQGVAHYKHKVVDGFTVDGAYPGELGNIFLFGHSQVPGGDMSNYSGVFNDLSKLSIGDEIMVFYQGQKYVYRVYEGQVVTRNQIEYLAPTDEETLTLMSCWPLGLDVKRYIVRAKPV
ncbi:hypothetical protein COY32_03725 [candidate division WWE3 bacterium CG_4_10_14_0_2_um_filter_41_14]|uniref:Sortase n=1 Tax=candidate division WWE3 bacterium CG_4_10_14_0_2_um_filter_41_14 TaxID=1975072 RepID=A0A2M7TIF8_UNCKA|nr:MAG: hypothetical protein COY32_03725 [candidate division WWE3 bacterium CG_4_10_14_0_2_um_filter_41_14]